MHASTSAMAPHERSYASRGCTRATSNRPPVRLVLHREDLQFRGADVQALLARLVAVGRSAWIVVLLALVSRRAGALVGHDAQPDVGRLRPRNLEGAHDQGRGARARRDRRESVRGTGEDELELPVLGAVNVPLCFASKDLELPQ